MVNANKLNDLIVEKGYSQAEIARLIGIAPKTFYEKMSKGVFLSNEIEKMIDILGVQDESQVIEIFFKRKMKLNKEKFLKTELGSSLKECIAAWDKWLEIKDEKAAYWCQAQWEVYKMAIRQFYGIEYYFSRTDEYFGICTEDESDWLFKMER